MPLSERVATVADVLPSYTLFWAVKLPVRDFLFTTCDSAALVLALNCGLPVVVPLYSAVMLCGLATAERVDVEHVAVLPLSATAAQIVVAPSLNVTVPTPLGLPPVAVTVAVNVKESPYVLGLAPAVRVTVVAVARTAEVTVNLK